MATKRVKRKPKKLLLILIIIIIGILLGIGYFVFFNKKELKENKVVSTIPKYSYVLKSNKSKAYKDLFQELKDVLKQKKVDEKKYAKTITKMFIVDFYSLGDHTAKTDVGGVEFVHKEAEANFLINAQDTLYKYVESNIYKKRKQKLPIVNEITIDSIKTTDFTYNSNEDKKAYEVKVSWTYKDKIVAKDYQNEATLIFIHDDIKLVLVELSNE